MAAPDEHRQPQSRCQGARLGSRLRPHPKAGGTPTARLAGGDPGGPANERQSPSEAGQRPGRAEFPGPTSGGCERELRGGACRCVNPLVFKMMRGLPMGLTHGFNLSDRCYC